MSTDDRFDLDVGRVWREERVSCPHVDVLRAYLMASLSAGAMDFMRFHLETSRCPYCSSAIEELRALEAASAASSMTDLRDRLMRSTRVALRRGGAG